jgi:hypothetical protein
VIHFGTSYKQIKNKTEKKRENTKNKTILGENIKNIYQIYKIEKFDNLFSIDESFVFT